MFSFLYAYYLIDFIWLDSRTNFCVIFTYVLSHAKVGFLVYKEWKSVKLNLLKGREKIQEKMIPPTHQDG